MYILYTLIFIINSSRNIISIIILYHILLLFINYNLFTLMFLIYKDIRNIYISLVNKENLNSNL